MSRGAVGRVWGRIVAPLRSALASAGLLKVSCHASPAPNPPNPHPPATHRRHREARSIDRSTHVSRGASISRNALQQRLSGPFDRRGGLFSILGRRPGERAIEQAKGRCKPDLKVRIDQDGTQGQYCPCGLGVLRSSRILWAVLQCWKARISTDLRLPMGA